MGVLCIVRLSTRASIFEGANDLILNRGLGWISSRAKPGSVGIGNIGLAGHRDGFSGVPRTLLLETKCSLPPLAI